MDLKHIAIIMDGNGRWARKRFKTRTEGHKQGLEVAKKIVKEASRLKIDFITLYVFSSENWKRTENEVGFLMKLIEKHLIAEFDFYKANNIKVKHIGDLDGLPLTVQNAIKKVTCETSFFTGTTVLLAINYGAQDEILRAVRSCTKSLVENCCKLFLSNIVFDLKNTNLNTKIDNSLCKTITEKALQDLSPDLLKRHLDTSDVPPVDLLIRTGGEKRISNFLLYQIAYAELYFSEKLWPDWTELDLNEAIAEYQKRDRRFGNA